MDRLTGGRVVSYGYQYGEGVGGWVVLLGDEPPAAEVIASATDWRIEIYYAARNTMAELLDAVGAVEVTGNVLFAEIDERLNAVRIGLKHCDTPLDEFASIGDVNMVFEVRAGEEPQRNAPRN